MIIIEQYTDVAGKLRCICQLNNGMNLMLKFQSQPSQIVLDEIEEQYLNEHKYDDIPRIPLTINNHFELIKEFVIQVKKHPNLTITRYNNYLTTKQWWEAAIIRLFVFKLATELENMNDVVLANCTESQVLLKLRKWIVETPVRKIAKVITGIAEEI